jgi:acyl-CoA reductase-like NAD-dependent aldehyde dehydrogenase
MMRQMDPVTDVTPEPAPETVAPDTNAPVVLDAPAAPSVAVAPTLSRDPLADPAPTPTPPPVTAPADVAGMVARAREAQVAWAARSIEERIHVLRPVKDRVLDRAEAIGREVHRETGKPEVEAILSEVLPSADVVHYWSMSIEELLSPTEIELDRMSYPGKSGWTYREPRGTVALITPWNYPVALPLRTLIPALLAGNAVVWKPSEVTPGAGAVVAALFDGLLPEGVLSVAHGGGDVGQALAEADVDLVVFVGGVATGRKVARACAERVSPCALELGGKDAAIVLADANLTRAANGVVWGALTNAGQNCGAIERVYVERAVAEAFIEQVKIEVAALRPGVEMGPMTTERQRAVVAEQVAAEVSLGGTILQGATATERFIAPIVMRVESDASSLMQEETFGPVIPIAVVADVEEAVARANASRFGLTASIWTKDITRAEKLAQRLRAGVVTINNHAFTGALPGAPWSGHGQSGYGVTNSPSALESLTRPRFVLTDRSRAKRELWWYPYTPGLRQVALSMALVRSGSTGVFRKIGALFALIGGFLKRFKK